MKEILKRIEGMTSGEAVIFGVWKGFIWSAELFAIAVLAAILDSFVPHAPCAPRAFMAIQMGFALAIVLADGVDTAIECLYAWIAGYFLAFAVVGTTWFQG